LELSQNALDIGLAVRTLEGTDVKGVGPDIGTLVTLDGVKDKDPAAILAALGELEAYGYFRVSRCIASPRPGVPKELLGVAKVAILEPLQALFDGMGV